jgi:hypothetical protein
VRYETSVKLGLAHAPADVGPAGKRPDFSSVVCGQHRVHRRLVAFVSLLSKDEDDTKLLSLFSLYRWYTRTFGTRELSFNYVSCPFRGSGQRSNLKPAILSNSDSSNHESS